MPAEPTSASYSFQRFLSEIKSKGLARHNRFAVYFKYPKKLHPGNDLDIRDESADLERNVLLLCESVQLPSYSFFSTPVRIFGEVREAPYDKVYAPIPMSFYVDANMNVKYLFDKWAGLIQNPVTRRYGYYNDFAIDMSIIVYNVSASETYRIICREVFPKELQMISMEQNARDMMRLNVNMQIKYWTVTPIENLNDINKHIPSQGLLGYYDSEYNKFQDSFNRFDSATNPDGSFSDVRGFITGANRTAGDGYINVDDIIRQDGVGFA